MPASRSIPRRPGALFAASIVVAYVLAALAIPTGIALTVIDADAVDLPNTVVAGISLLGVAMFLAGLVLHVGYRLLEAASVRRSGDTGEIPRIRDTAVDSSATDRRWKFQEVDRAEAARILREADRRFRDEVAESAELTYLDRYRELTQHSNQGGLHAISNDQN